MLSASDGTADGLGAGVGPIVVAGVGDGMGVDRLGAIDWATAAQAERSVPSAATAPRTRRRRRESIGRIIVPRSPSDSMGGHD